MHLALAWASNAIPIEKTDLNFLPLSKSERRVFQLSLYRVGKNLFGNEEQ
jgi:hypothetical protein